MTTFMFLCLAVFLMQSHRVSRARDAIATVEASQVPWCNSSLGRGLSGSPAPLPVRKPLDEYGARSRCGRLSVKPIVNADGGTAAVRGLYVIAGYVTLPLWRLNEIRLKRRR